MQDFGPPMDRYGSRTDQSATSVLGLLMFHEQTFKARLKRPP